MRLLEGGLPAKANLLHHGFIARKPAFFRGPEVPARIAQAERITDCRGSLFIYLDQGRRYRLLSLSSSTNTHRVFPNGAPFSLESPAEEREVDVPKATRIMFSNRSVLASLNAFIAEVKALMAWLSPCSLSRLE